MAFCDFIGATRINKAVCFGACLSTINFCLPMLREEMEANHGNQAAREESVQNGISLVLQYAE